MSVINKNNLFCDTDAEEAKIYSYSTLVGVVKNGKLYRVLEGLALPKITKKEWEKMEVISICD